MAEKLISWDQDFVSEDWAVCVDGKPVLWVRPCGDTGRGAFEVTDAQFNRIGGLDATLEGAKARAYRIREARGL